ncbi:ABC-type glycerol-3-phosphate transport system substrate-binding protein, partial [Streptacidiphilus sp. MAP12-20]
MRTSSALRVARPRRAVVSSAVALSAAVTLLVTGCSSGGGSGSGNPSGSSAAKITLTVGDFGTFGYKEAGLFDAYMAAHPNITIKEDTTTAEADYWTALQTHLSAGGLDDIQALEVGRISLATSDALSSAFEDLSKAPGVNRSDYLPWKWAQATTASG